MCVFFTKIKHEELTGFIKMPKINCVILNQQSSPFS